MGPARKSKSVYKRYSGINEASPVKHEEAADRRVPRVGVAFITDSAYQK